MIRFGLLIPLAVVLSMSTACATTKNNEDVVIRGQGIEITTGDIERELRLLGEEQRARAVNEEAQMQNLVTRMFFRRRMALLADELGYLDDELVQLRLQRQREESLSQIVPQRFLDSLEMPDFDAQARSFYEDNIDEFTPDETIRASHILLKAVGDEEKARRRPEAEALLQRLAAGESFGDLAEEYSEDGSRFMRGDLGYFPPGRMVPEFDEAAFALEEPGDHTGLVDSRFGWHIIKLLERPSVEPRPFEEVRERIVEKLRQEYRQEKLGEWVREHVSPGVAEVQEDRLAALREAMRREFGGAPEEDDEE